MKYTNEKIERVIKHCNAKSAEARKMSDRMAGMKIYQRYNLVANLAANTEYAYMPNGDEAFRNFLVSQMKPGNTDPSSPLYPVLAEVYEMMK